MFRFIRFSPEGPQAGRHFGRIHAACGGVLVAGSLPGAWSVDRFRPDRWDVIGAGICLGGVVVIMYAPRATHSREYETAVVRYGGYAARRSRCGPPPRLWTTGRRRTTKGRAGPRAGQAVAAQRARSARRCGRAAPGRRRARRVVRGAGPRTRPGCPGCWGTARATRGRARRRRRAAPVLQEARAGAAGVLDKARVTRPSSSTASADNRRAASRVTRWPNNSRSTAASRAGGSSSRSRSR
jgi:hypothetical protein